MAEPLVDFVTDARYEKLSAAQRAEAFGTLEPAFRSFNAEQQQDFITKFETKYRPVPGAEQTGLPGVPKFQAEPEYVSPGIDLRAGKRKTTMAEDIAGSYQGTIGEAVAPRAAKWTADIMGRFAGATGEGIGNIATGLGNILHALGTVADSDTLRVAGGGVASAGKTVEREFKPEKTGGEGVTAQLPEIAGSAIGSMMGFRGAGKLVGKAVEAMAGTGKAGAIASWLATSAVETGTTAGGVYEDELQAGKDPGKAAGSAGKFAAISGPMTAGLNKLGQFNDRIRNPIARTLAELSGEIAQEDSEQITQNMVTGKPWNLGLAESTVGAVFGSLVGGAAFEHAAVTGIVRDYHEAVKAHGASPETAREVMETRLTEEAPHTAAMVTTAADETFDPFTEISGVLKESAKQRDAAVEAFLAEHPEYRDEVLGPPEAPDAGAVDPVDEEVPGEAPGDRSQETEDRSQELATAGVPEVAPAVASEAPSVASQNALEDQREGSNQQPVLTVDYTLDNPEPDRPGSSRTSGSSEDLPLSDVRISDSTSPQPDNRTDAAKPETPKREFSSTQVNLPEDLANDVRTQSAAIAEEDLAEKGREDEPHVTVKYGLHGDDAEQVRQLLAAEPPVRVKLGATSLFENEDGDVVKVDVDSEDLRRLNAKIAGAVENSDTHPEYKPHVTLGFVKPGRGKKYAGNTALAGREVTLDTVVFSDRNGKRTEIPLGGKAAAEEEVRSQKTEDRMDGAPKAPRKGRAKKTAAAAPTLAEAAAEVQPTLPKLKQRPFGEAVQAHGRWEAKLLQAQAAGKSTTFIGKMVDKHAAAIRMHLGENYAGPLTAEEILDDASIEAAKADKAASKQEEAPQAKPQKVKMQKPTPKAKPAIRTALPGAPGLFQLQDDEARSIRMRFNRIMAASIRQKPYSPHGGRSLRLKQTRAVARASRGEEPGIIYLNRQARFTLTALFHKLLGHPTPGWLGLAMEGKFVPRVMRALEQEAVSVLTDQDSRDAHSRLLDAFQKASIRGLPVVLVEAGPEISLQDVATTRRHEKIHSVQHILGGGMPAGHVNESQFLNSEPAQIARKKLRSMNYSDDDATMAAEIAAWIGAGEWSKIGLAEEQAFLLFEQYINLLRAQHGDAKAKPMLRWIFPRLRTALKEKGVISYERTSPKQASRAKSDPARRGLPEGREGGSARRVEPDVSPVGKQTAPDRNARSSRNAGGIRRRDQAGDTRNAAAVEERGFSRKGRLGGSAGVASADLLAAPVLRGAELLGAGVRTFREWKARLVEEYGPSIKHKALSLWAQAKRLWNDETGTLRLDKLAEWYRNSAAHSFGEVIKPIRRRIAEAGEGTGRDLMRLLDKASNEGEVLAGMLLVKLRDVELHKLKREERFQLLDALEGRATPDSLSDRVREVYAAARSVGDELAIIADDLDVMVSTPDGKRKFKARADYFPHVIRTPEALKKGPVRRDVIENLVRIKEAENAEQATVMLDNFVKGVESGRWDNRILEQVMRTNPEATSRAKALAMLQRYRSHVHRHGTLEHSREVQLPFYDPDPARVLPWVTSTSAIRLAQIAEFGQDHPRINAEILKIRDAGGDADFVRNQVDKILGLVMAEDDAEKRLSVWLRTLMSFKLGLAQIPNATQGALNTMLAGDFAAVAAGVRGMLTKRGRRLAIESGAAIDPVLAEAARDLGEKRSVDAFLKWTGFSAAEQMNRVFAANAGANFAGRLVQRLAKMPEAKRGASWEWKRLEDLGIEPGESAARGKLNHGEMLMAAKVFSDMTQFRTRVQDQPSLAKYKVMWQFKSFAYNQGRLIARETIGEWKRGHPGRAMRAMLVIGLFFPLVGDLVRALRDLIRGKEREFENLFARYVAALSEVGGLGIPMDAIRSAGARRGVEFIAGPSLSEAARVAEVLASDKDAEEKLEALGKFARKQIPFGSVVFDRGN